MEPTFTDGCRFWRLHQAFVDLLGTITDDNPETAETLKRTWLQQRRLWRRYLRRRCGFKSMVCWRPPTTPVDSDRFLHAFENLFTYVVLYAVARAGAGAQRQLELLAEIPLWFCLAKTQAGFDEAALDLAGWALAHLSLGRNQRLAQAFQDEPDLLDLFPGSALLAWESCDHDQPLTQGRASYLSTIARLLEQERLSDYTKVNPASLADAFTAAEEARIQLSDLVHQAGLSPREAELLDLLLKEHTETEAAATMGLAVGTVRSLRHRLYGKLRRVS